MLIERIITESFLLKLHKDALAQRLELISEVRGLSREDKSQIVFEVGRYDALTPQEIREIIQGGENISDMAYRVRTHVEAIEKLGKPIILPV